MYNSMMFGMLNNIDMYVWIYTYVYIYIYIYICMPPPAPRRRGRERRSAEAATSAGSRIILYDIILYWLTAFKVIVRYIVSLYVDHFTS